MSLDALVIPGELQSIATSAMSLEPMAQVLHRTQRPESQKPGHWVAMLAEPIRFASMMFACAKPAFKIVMDPSPTAAKLQEIAYAKSVLSVPVTMDQR